MVRKIISRYRSIMTTAIGNPRSTLRTIWYFGRLRSCFIYPAGRDRLNNSIWFRFLKIAPITNDWVFSEDASHTVKGRGQARSNARITSENNDWNIFETRLDPSSHISRDNKIWPLVRSLMHLDSAEPKPANRRDYNMGKWYYYYLVRPLLTAILQIVVVSIGGSRL